MDVEAIMRKRLGRRDDNRHARVRDGGGRIETGITLLDGLCSGHDGKEDNDDDSAVVRGGSVIEVVGGTNSGKTRLLHMIAAHALVHLDSEVAIENNSDKKKKSSVKVKPIVCWYDMNGGLDIHFLCRLLTKRTRSTERSLQLLRYMNVYTAGGTLEVCASLRDASGAGEWSMVKCVIIDALGISHYHDKYTSERRMRRNVVPVDMELAQEVQRVLTVCGNGLVVYCSKCGLFGGEKLAVVKWPFGTGAGAGAGRPEMPGDFMPERWKRMVTHVILLYHVDAGGGDGDGVQKGCARRGALCMYYGRNKGTGKAEHGGKLRVGGASVLVIEEDAVTMDEAHTVMTA